MVFQYNSAIPFVSGIPPGNQIITNVIWTVTHPVLGDTTYSLPPGNNLQILADTQGNYTVLHPPHVSE